MTLLVPTTINGSVAAISAISTIAIPVAAEAEGIGSGCVKGMIRWDLEVKVTDLVLVIDPAATHSHSQSRSLLPLRLVDKGRPILEVFVIIHARNALQQGLC